ncbi:hypothetical protein [Macrococcus capreoli]|uniref:hypothetical protein n=1 Tax=Macrococcus capreoli TaxID=2982690 RepID=UPI003F435054
MESLKELQEVKKQLKSLDERVKKLEDDAIKTSESIEDLKALQKENHDDLTKSHQELKNSQLTITSENLEQTKILNRIEERYQAQVDLSLKNESSAQAFSKWLLGAVWALVAIVLITVITASINALIP